MFLILLLILPLFFLTVGCSPKDDNNIAASNITKEPAGSNNTITVAPTNTDQLEEQTGAVDQAQNLFQGEKIRIS